jgi:AraC-like DNA-binding protein
MLGASGPRLQRFTTTNLPPGERYEAWLNRGWPSLAPTYLTTPLEPFNTASEHLALGSLVIHFAKVTGLQWRRDQAMIRSWNPDSLIIAITQAGTAHGLFGTRSARTGPGSVHLVDLAQPSLHDSTSSRTVLLTVPRVVAAASGLDVTGLHGVVLHSTVAAMLGPHLLALRDAVPELQTDDVPKAERTVLDLLGLAVRGSGRGEVRVRVAARTAGMLARQEIESMLESPALTIANLHRRLGISRSGLHRLFEAEGGVQAYIRARRLEAVRRVLADPNVAESIQLIAERFGFSDASHLSRLFRTRYGMTAGDYRRDPHRRES